MKSPIFSRTIVVPLIFLIACQAQAPTGIPVPTATANITSPPTSTPIPDPEIISPENASQLVLKFMNMGTVLGFPAFSPDGKWLYQESTVGTYAFDTISYQDVHLLASTPTEMLLPNAETFSGLEASGFVLYEQSIFSPDRSLIAGYFRSDFTTVWRLADGKLINQFDGQPNEISPDNRLITIGRRESYDTYTRYYVDLYDLQTGEQLGSWGVRRAFFLSDNRLAVESSDGYTRIFDPVIRKVPHAFAGWYAAFSPDEQNVAVLYGNQIHIYQVSNGKLLRKFDSGLPSTDAANLRFSANGEILAGFTIEYYCCAGYSSRFFIWQASDGRLLTDLSRSESFGDLSNRSFSLSHDGQAILVNRQVLRTSDGSLIVDLGTYFIGSVKNIAFTPDGQQIIVLDADNHLYLYPVDGGIFSTPQDADRDTYLRFLQPASGSSSDDVIDAPSPDGKALARRYLGVVTIWNASGEGKLFEIPLYQVRCLAFSPDGQILALGLPNGSVELWNVYSKQKIYTLPARADDNSKSVGGLAFSPDGKLLAVGMLDGTVRLYGLNTR